MDNITHTFVGAALAQTGLDRWTPLATTTLLLGANFPDIDVVVGLSDRLTYLEHHRGITHAIAAIPLLSLLLAGLVYAGSRWWHARQPDQKPARFWPLFWLSLISMSTHPLLDFTNSYGWRPFLPWDHTWFYGDIDFVVDPWLWVSLGGLLMLATATTKARLLRWSILFALLAVPVLLFAGIHWQLKSIWLAVVLMFFSARAVLHLRTTSTQWLMRGLVIIVLLYFGLLTWLQNNALHALQMKAPQMIQAGEKVIRVDALPLPGNPFLRQGVISTDQTFYFFRWHLLSSSPSPSVWQASRIIPQTTGDAAAIHAARRDPEIQAFLRFARFPVLEATPQAEQKTRVRVRDVRFELEANAISTFQASILLDAQLRRIMD
jgi:inner membrane protein